MAERLVNESGISQAEFLRQYLDCLDPTEAVHRALERENPEFLCNQATGSDVEDIAAALLADKDVATLLTTQLTQAVQTQRIVSARWVLEKAQEVFLKCNQEKHIKNANGDEIIGPFQPVPALRALELVGKHTDIRAFREIVEHDVGDNLAQLLDDARKRKEQAYYDRDVIDVTPESLPDNSSMADLFG